MKKEILEWNYNLPTNMKGIQRDWNQTIMTLINMAHKMLDMPKKVKLFVPKNLESFIQTIESYDSKNKILSSKIPVTIINSDINELILSSKKKSIHIKIINYEC